MNFYDESISQFDLRFSLELHQAETTLHTVKANFSGFKMNISVETIMQNGES